MKKILLLLIALGILSGSSNAASELLSNLHKQGGTTVFGHGYKLDTTGRRTAETSPAPRTYG